MKYWKFALFAISLCFAPLLSAEDSAPKVMTSLGEVQGITENGIRIFRGIPYAEPPIGDLRWQATQPKTAWEGTLDASDYGPQCPQGFGEQTIPQDEDCLTINVWTPEVVEEPLPVMFWIHGGAHVLGNGRIQGETFARDGVVLVSINYRLGPFGVFALSEIVKNTPEGEPTGNFHLLDQIEALKWVQREIGTFGGDPGKVTIFGVSAGGSNVNLLMMSPLSNGLFHGAIAQSAGNGLSPSLDLATQSFLDDRILGALSVDDLAGLRALPWYRIIQSGPDSRGPSGPIVDGIAVKENVSQAFQAGRQHDVPYIGGANSHEGSLRVFIPIPDYDQELEANREELAPFYGLESNDPSLVVDYYGDRLFVAPTRFIVSQMSKVNASSWHYHFDWVLEDVDEHVPGAGHGSEVAYVFDSLETFTVPPEFAQAIGIPAGTYAPSAKDLETAALVHRYWINFAETGSPTHEDAFHWGEYTNENPQTLLISNDGHSMQENLRASQLSWIEDKALGPSE